MSLPRPVLPGQFYMITRRCTQRQFLLRPDDETNNAFVYCLAVAAQRTQMEILSTVAMSNHHHTIIYDRHGRYPEFIEHFHKLVARCLNRLRNRCENFWSSEQVCVVRLVTREDVINKLVYVATNPVNADLVERSSQWPGVNAHRELKANMPLRATRPTFFFRDVMPDSVELQLAVPEELGVSREELIVMLEERISVVETEARARRCKSRKSVLGPRGVRAQRWSARPQNTEAPRKLRPRIAAMNKWARIEALIRNDEFLEAYQHARASMLSGDSTPFPLGTYWLRRFARVPIALA